jgi:hypothetical protein
MKIGAVDTICSLLDDRPYQGGKHTLQEIIKIIKQNNPNRVKWMWMVYSSIKNIPKPDLEQVNNPDKIPNIGLPIHVYNRVKHHTQQVMKELRQKHNYNF